MGLRYTEATAGANALMGVIILVVAVGIVVIVLADDKILSQLSFKILYACDDQRGGTHGIVVFKRIVIVYEPLEFLAVPLYRKGGVNRGTLKDKFRLLHTNGGGGDIGGVHRQSGTGF